MFAPGCRRTKYWNKTVPVLLWVNSSRQHLTPPPPKPLYLQNHTTLNPTFYAFYYPCTIRRCDLRDPKELSAENICRAGGKKAKLDPVKKLIPTTVFGTQTGTKFFKESDCFKKRALKGLINYCNNTTV